MRLIISVSVRENYGAHDWDGEGECPQYWKCKGVSDTEVENWTETDVDKINEYVKSVLPLIEQNNDYFICSYLDWEILGDNELTETEKDWLEFEGRKYPMDRIIDGKLVGPYELTS